MVAYVTCYLATLVLKKTALVIKTDLFCVPVGHGILSIKDRSDYENQLSNFSF